MQNEVVTTVESFRWSFAVDMILLGSFVVVVVLCWILSDKER